MADVAFEGPVVSVREGWDFSATLQVGGGAVWERSERRTAFHAIKVDVCAFLFVVLCDGWRDVAAGLAWSVKKGAGEGALLVTSLCPCDAMVFLCLMCLCCLSCLSCNGRTFVI